MSDETLARRIKDESAYSYSLEYAIGLVEDVQKKAIKAFDSVEKRSECQRELSGILETLRRLEVEGQQRLNSLIKKAEENGRKT